MFRKALIVGAAVAACLALLPARVNTQRAAEQFNGHDVMPGEVLVRLRDALQLPAIRQLTDAADDRPVGTGAWRRIRSNSRTVQTLIQLLAARGDVEVEPNYILRAIGLPNDPSLSALWNLGSSPGIHATSVWSFTTGNAATVVGVIDSGIDYTHPDLAANVWSAPSQFTVTVGGRSITCPAGSHGFNAIQFTCDPLDDLGHGTHVSGTIGAVGNNNIGVVGVNWTTGIMGLKFISSAGSGSSADAINAIDFAIQTRALFGGSGGGADVRVLSNSYGGGGFETAFSDAIGRANTAGMLFAAAAGNNGTNNDAAPFYPASYTGPNMMAVAASDSNDNLASFSNYGAQSVDLAAPGVSILSTTPANTYSYLSGTSMATPHVSGAAALVLSACRLTTAQLIATLMNTVDPRPAFAGLTVSGGRLDVDNAIHSCATFPSVTLTSPIDGSTYGSPAQIALAATASDAAGITKVEFYDGTNLIATSTTAPYGGTWSNAAAGSHDVTAVAYDSLGLSTVSADAHITVTTTTSGAQTLLTTETPASYLADSPYELGVRLVADVDGQFTAVRFWKAAQEAPNTVHVGHVWTAGGQLLGSVTFTNESVSGWQQQQLPSPISVAAGTQYVVSVNDANYFPDTQHAFDNGLIHGHLRALSGTNGVYSTSPGSFPSGSYASSNYFRDVVFVPGTTGGGTDTQPPTVAITQPAPNSVVNGSVTVTANATDDVGVAGVQFQIDGVSLGQEDTSAPYSATWDTTTATNGSHSVTAIARDGANHTASQTITVTVSNSVTSGTLLTSQTPASFPNDGTAYELGVRLVTDVDGQFTAVRFWKAPQDSGAVHVGRVWSAGGQLLGSVTFTNESASGWQQQSLATPVAVTAGTEYVVTVNAAGNFADTQHVFDNGLVNGHLRAVSWTNGVYGASGAFPTSSYGSSNYFRDVVFVPGVGF
jgi:subtilisin family serine protease